MTEEKEDKMEDRPEPGSIENGWSVGEKTVLVQVYRKSRPLDYPLETRMTASGAEELVYSIPEDKKEEELRKCWPFEESAPAPDELLFDVHSSAKFVLRDCMIVRSQSRNMLVSPHYLESGGMAVDIVPVAQMKKYPVPGFMYSIKPKGDAEGRDEKPLVCVTGLTDGEEARP